MGREAAATLVYRGKRARGKALLETEEILFRSPEIKLRIPRGDIRRAAVEDGVLALSFGRDTASLELGAQAEKWAHAIQNPRTRLDKLGVKAAHKVALVGKLDEDFVAELSARAPPQRLAAGTDVIFFAVDRPGDLARLAALREKLLPTGALWVVRRKGPDATVSETAVMDAARAQGLVDVKVAAFSPTHTAEKLVIPVKQR